MDPTKPFDYVAELTELSAGNFRKQARIDELEAELARQIACREDSDRKFMEADDALNRSALELAEARKEIAVARAAADWFRSELKSVGLIVSRQLLNRGQGDWAAFTSLKQKVQVAVNMSALDAARAAEGGKR